MPKQHKSQGQSIVIYDRVGIAMKFVQDPTNIEFCGVSVMLFSALAKEFESISSPSDKSYFEGI